MFLEQVINSKRYVLTFIDVSFWRAVQEKEHYFMQNGATAHAANYSFNVLDQLLEEVLGSPLLWPARSVDLKPP
jgi:hypothetical protein